MKNRMKLAIGTVLAAVCMLASAQDALQVRSWAAACASCHGTVGIAVDGGESIAGIPKDRFLKRMQDYKSGAKSATIMHQIAKGYSDKELEQLAGYFAALKN